MRATAPAAHRFLVIARIVAPHGVRGDVRAEIITDFASRLARTRMVYVGDPPAACEVESARLVRGGVIFKFQGVETRDQAEHLRRCEVLVPFDEAQPLPPGQFYWSQIVGLEVKDDANKSLGRVTEVFCTGSNDVYVVRGQHAEWLLPSTREVIQAIDLDNKVIRVRLLAGMGPEA